VAENDVPEDLVKLKAAFWAADAECAALSARPDPADPDEQQRARDELKAANLKRLGIITEMYAHPWWATQNNRYEADLAVNAAAKAAGGRRP
jgi:hypothetical protein